MLVPYFGEFLVSPIPLELSGNYCSHKCAYCFANLNKPDRRLDEMQLLRLLADFQNRKTWESHLLRCGYPVVVSNKTDPFSASNWKIFVPVLRLMTELGIPVAIQTKGGKGVEEVMEFLPRSAWYVSVGYMDDRIRKRIEPGAPAVEERFEMIQELVWRGHHVSAAINPLVSEWLPDPVELLTKLWGLGVRATWVETLHLNNNQTRNLSDRERANLGADVIRTAYRKKDEGVRRLMVDTFSAARAMGFETFCVNNPYRSGYFKPYERIYQKRFPTMQGFLNDCIDRRREVIRFADLCDYMLPHLPPATHNLMDYIGASNPYMKREIVGSKISSWKALLAAFWRIEESRLNPYRNVAFDFLQENGRDVLENGMPVFRLTGEGL